MIAFLLTDVRNSPNCNKLNLENWKAFRLLHIYFIIGKGKLKFYERTNSSGDGIILVKLRIFEIHFCGNGNQLSYRVDRYWLNMYLLNNFLKYAKRTRIFFNFVRHAEKKQLKLIKIIQSNESVCFMYQINHNH